MEALQRKVYNIVRDDDEDNRAGKIFDGFIVILIILNVLVLILDSFAMPAWFRTAAAVFEVVSIVIFTVEYALRIWTAPLMYPLKSPARARIKYILSFMALVDLISILPFYLPFVIPIDLRVLRVLRIFRLLRVFKISRYTYALYTITMVFKRKQGQLVSSIFAVLVLMLITSILLYNVENHAQPDVFQNALSGMWWSLSVITGAWYGDIYPITLWGKILGGVVALLSVALVAVPTGIISAGFVQIFQEESREESNQETATDIDGVVDEILNLRAQLQRGLVSQNGFRRQVQEVLDEKHQTEKRQTKKPT